MKRCLNHRFWVRGALWTTAVAFLLAAAVTTVSTQSALPKEKMPRPIHPAAQGGSGPVKVMLVYKNIPFERNDFFEMFDSMGKEITWTIVEHPAAEIFMGNPDLAKMFDVMVFYDSSQRIRTPDGKSTYVEPTPQLKKGFTELLNRGTTGFVFLHHALSAYNHTWPEYSEAMGGVCDWGNPVTFKGKEYPPSGAIAFKPYFLNVVDKTHPVTQGLGDGFEVVDEAYLCPMDEENVHPLMRSSLEPVDKSFAGYGPDGGPDRYAKGWRHPPGSNLVAYTKSAGKSPVVYIQPGHDSGAYKNPLYRTLISNSIRWAASKEARDWAAANPVKRTNE